MFAILTKIIDRLRIKNTKMWSGNVISLNRMKRVNFSRRVDFSFGPIFSAQRASVTVMERIKHFAELRASNKILVDRSQMHQLHSWPTV